MTTSRSTSRPPSDPLPTADELKAKLMRGLARERALLERRKMPGLSPEAAKHLDNAILLQRKANDLRRRGLKILAKKAAETKV